jgi:ribosomal protein S18 acetylase RimI-like enzyme
MTVCARAMSRSAPVTASSSAAARDQGIRALELEVARDNVPARRLYARLGFEARANYVLMSANL